MLGSMRWRRSTRHAARACPSPFRRALREEPRVALSSNLERDVYTRLFQRIEGGQASGRGSDSRASSILRAIARRGIADRVWRGIAVGATSGTPRHRSCTTDHRPDLSQPAVSGSPSGREADAPVVRALATRGPQHTSVCRRARRSSRGRRKATSCGSSRLRAVRRSPSPLLGNLMRACLCPGTFATPDSGAKLAITVEPAGARRRARPPDLCSAGRSISDAVSPCVEGVKAAPETVLLFRSRPPPAWLARSKSRSRTPQRPPAQEANPRRGPPVRLRVVRWRCPSTQFRAPLLCCRMA